VARMGRTIGTDITGAIQWKCDVQILQCYIMNQLIVGPLQKGRVNSHDGLFLVTDQAGNKSHRMLFGNTHVKITARKALFELDQATALAHGGSNTVQTAVLVRAITDPLTKHLGKTELFRWLGFGRLYPYVRVKAARSVI